MVPRDRQAGRKPRAKKTVWGGRTEGLRDRISLVGGRKEGQTGRQVETGDSLGLARAWLAHASAGVCLSRPRHPLTERQGAQNQAPTKKP